MDLSQIVLGVAGFCVSTILIAIWRKIGELEKADKALARELSAIHILVAGEYVKRVEVSPMLEKIFDELTQIRRELAGKEERRRA